MWMEVTVLKGTALSKASLDCNLKSGWKYGENKGKKLKVSE